MSMPPVVGSGRQRRCGSGLSMLRLRLLAVACFAVAAVVASSLCCGCCFFAAAACSGGAAVLLPSDSGRMAGAAAHADDHPEGSYYVGRRRLLAGGPGSHPPRCTSKCGGCSPCYPVHVSVPPGNVVVTTEYYPVAWRCKCGDRLYMP